MGDYPDPEEEYELMYSDDLELIREMDDDTDSKVLRKKVMPAKRSLDFSHPVQNQSFLNSQQNDLKDSGGTPSSQPATDIFTTVPTKRTAEDLFGDINDIDFDDLGLPCKKQKTDEENDLELINKIIEGRKMRQLLAEPSRALLDNKPNYNINNNMSLKIPKWAFMPFTNWDGERVYVRMESEENWEKSLDIAPDQLSLKSMFAPVWEEARKILEAKQKKVETELVQDNTDTEKPDFTDLWVQKYKPKSYIDLLSEEPVNRCLLHWLHLWDKIVFNKDVKIVEPQQRNAFSKRTGQFQLSNKWRGKREEPEMDEDGRPRHKLALLCGPPGVGKTTLAHLLATLAGYRPVELNASDERSTEQFQNALQNATLMRSVLDAQKRPNCLILDEIDGAPIQTVELLVRWCSATARKEEGKKKSKVHALKRPVIAICNDLYATSLRSLRPVALVVSVGAVCASRLGARLRQVSRRERVRVGARALAALAARASGDVRAALTALSFLRAGDRQINVEDVENVAIGTKDNTQSMMQALQAIFTITNSDHNAVLKTIQAAGEYERLADGIFENYPCSRSDPRLLIACATSELLALFDTTYSWTLRSSNYSLYGILPSLLARCHDLLATRQPARVRFPMTAQEMFRKKTELDSILWSIWRGSTVYTTKKALKLDIVPLLPYLLSPVLRSANIQLCTASERDSVRVCAGALCDYGVLYVQRRDPAGYTHALEPDIHRLAFFGPEEKMLPPPAVRQAIAAEQQLEMIRRNEEMMNRTSGRIEDKRVNKSKTPAVLPPVTETKESRVPNHLQRLQPKVIERNAPQVQKDFFGRIVPVAQIQNQVGISDAISSSAVFYQYREGFNNAVRRNVRMRDLM